MPDEVEFDRALRLAGNFVNIYLRAQLFHPTLPGQHIEIDNLAQKHQTIFVFEGKAIREIEAVKQLKERYLSLKLFRLSYVKAGAFEDYNAIRLFFYSLRRKVISEYNVSLTKISSNKFNDLNELAQILRKL